MIETLLVGAIVGVATRLGERWLDDFAQYLDSELRTQVKELSSVLFSSRGAATTAQVNSARHNLERYVQEHPQDIEVLARPPMPTTSETSRSLIEEIHAWLEFECALAASLRRPVALPGFLHCTACVTVIDARTEDNRTLQAPDLSPPSPLEASLETSTLYLMPEQAVFHGMPRIWFIHTEDEERRDTLCDSLNDRFWPQPPSILELNVFHLSHVARERYGLRDSEQVERLESIDRDRVTVVEEDRLPGEPKRKYYFTTLEGAELAGVGLARLVAQAAKAERRQRDALNQAPKTGA